MPATNSAPRPPEIDILDAQQEAAARTPGLLMAEERRQRMAEVQFPVRARCETENGLRLTHP